MSINLWGNEIKNLYKWSSAISAVYLGNDKIRPTTTQPKNAIAWRPLTEDADEKIAWMSYVAWTKPTIWTYTSASVKCWNFTSSTTPYYYWGLTMPASFTISAWAYNTWVYSADWKIIDLSVGTTTTNPDPRVWFAYILSYSPKNNYNLTMERTNYGVDSGTVSQNAWHHAVGVYNEWSTMKIYIDGNLKSSASCSSRGTWSATATLWNQYRDGMQRHFIWYLSDIAICSWAWSASDVSAYYNATKWNYWL